MPKKSPTLEIVPYNPQQEMAELKRLIADAVDEKVAEAMGSSDAIMQPWFQPKAIVHEIKRRQTVTEQQKFGLYFDEWGCMVCGTKDALHLGMGMCKPCSDRIRQRLRAIVLKHAPPPDQVQPSFRDTMKMAREALAPSIKSLAARRKWSK